MGVALERINNYYILLFYSSVLLTVCVLYEDVLGKKEKEILVAGSFGAFVI